MQVIEDEVLGELKYLVVEFDQAELLAGHIGVISQGAVRRYFEGKNPDLKVKKCGGLKLDSQRDIVTMRFGVVNRGGVITTVSDEVSDEVSEVKLLNPGYNELAAQVEGLKVQLELGAEVYDELKEASDIYVKVLTDNRDALQKKYDVLVVAVGKDAQKFSYLILPRIFFRFIYNILTFSFRQRHRIGRLNSLFRGSKIGSIFRSKVNFLLIECKFCNLIFQFFILHQHR